MPRWYTVTDPTGVLSINFNETNDDTGQLVPDGNGVYWAIEELEGWDGPDVRQVLVDPYGIDGTIVGVNELQSRLITFANGFAIAPSESARWAAESQWGMLLAATLAQGTCHVVVHEGETDLYLDGYLASKPEYKEVPPGSSGQTPDAWPFQFEGSLICPFPIKQVTPSGRSPQELDRDGSVAIDTFGNYPAWPVFTLDYPCNGDYIEDDLGNQILITSANRGTNAAPPMPTAIEIDLYNQTCVDQDGNSAWDVVAAIAFFQLKPNGGTTITYHLGSASPSGTQEAYCSWNDAWL